MKRITYALIMTAFITCLCSCNKTETEKEKVNYLVDRFADIQILRYTVPGFENLPLKQKELIYYLNQAALEGMDILYDQNYKHNLCIKRTLEAVYQYGEADTTSQDWKSLATYLKRIWASNGIHHHYATDKFVPGFSKEFFTKTVQTVSPDSLPLEKGENVQDFITKLNSVIFDPQVGAKRVNLSENQDLIQTSACNYYENVTQKEAEIFYNSLKVKGDSTPVSYGLNSKLIKVNGRLMEKVWKTDGMYGQALTKIVYWLKKASSVAENTKQASVINKLIEYYNTGDLKTFDEYCINWVEDLNSRTDFVNGFTETYGDPLGIKGAWESNVNFTNVEATKRSTKISTNAQWFEDNSPVAPEFRKEKVRGVTAKVITVTMLAGDCYPTTPIGINLPNSNWIRRDHGSKSVTIENITESYDKASQGTGYFEEFMIGSEEIGRIEKYGFIVDNLHTDLHECLGHGSGKILPGVDPDALKAYGSTIEEARADLFGLYYLADPKLVELGLTPDAEAYKAEYYKYVMNGLLTQLTRIEPGNDIEESHMRNRALIARWTYEKGVNDNVMELVKKNGKTFLKINNYESMRILFGKLLAEIQRIKSTGDLSAAQKIIEQYSVKVDPVLHKEMLERYTKLNLAPYKGFVNPEYTPLFDKNGIITDIKISYNEGYTEQHLRYSRDFSNLPAYN